MSGFEIFGLIIAIPAAVVQLKQTIQILRNQHQAFVENDSNMTRVTTVFDNLSDLLHALSEDLKTKVHLLPRASLAALTYEMQNVHDRIERASRELRDMTTRDTKSRSVARFLRSRKVRQDWQELETGAEKLMDTIRHMSLTCTFLGTTALLHRGRSTYVTQEEAMGTLDLTTSHPLRSLRDIDMNFSCTIYSPRNPPYVLADFSNPDSPESQLLSRILRESPNSVPDIYSSRKIELIGKCGRGKTCILQSLCTNQTLVSRFMGANKGGIYYINLGHNPDPNDVRRKLCDIVKASGGSRDQCDRILSENISMGIYILVQWFMHKDTLFLIDEAYDETALGAALTEQLITLSTTSVSSAVVFSRQRANNAIGEIVRVYPESDSGSRRLLLRSAEFDAEEIHDATTFEAIDSIVDMCHGNIRLLGQAGVCYKYLYEGGKPEAGWQKLAEKLKSRVGDGEDENEAQDALITEILNALQPGIRKLLKRAPSVHRLYRALHVVKAREWIPMTDLCKVWGLRCDECDAVAEVLLRGRLCRISYQLVGGVAVKGVEIHNCLWAYMVREAMKHGEIALTA